MLLFTFIQKTHMVKRNECGCQVEKGQPLVGLYYIKEEAHFPEFPSLFGCKY